jgi:hypothetical protein
MVRRIEGGVKTEIFDCKGTATYKGDKYPIIKGEGGGRIEWKIDLAFPIVDRAAEKRYREAQKRIALALETVFPEAVKLLVYKESNDQVF